MNPTRYRVDANEDGLTLVLEDGTTHASIHLRPNAARQLLLDANTKAGAFKHRFDYEIGSVAPAHGIQGGPLMEVISAPPPPEHRPGGKIHIQQQARKAA